MLLDNLSPNSLNKKCICSVHFDNVMYMNEQNRERLKPTAVSRKYIDKSKFYFINHYFNNYLEVNFIVLNIIRQ